MKNTYQKPNHFIFTISRFLFSIIRGLFFKVKYLRKELKGNKKPCVLVCNHECMFDMATIMGSFSTDPTFVISQSMLNSMPVKNSIKALNVIEKQQFQTKVSDMRRMKDVVTSGHQLVIYPAGLMPENGLSTPIPSATYRFLKWLGADIYIGRVCGSYFVMPKWSKGFHSGRTYLDIYKLCDSEELKTIGDEEFKEKLDEALLFDAYEEQEKFMIPYKNADKVKGLENVVYECPNCKREFSIYTKDETTLACKECGYEESMDRYGFLHAKEGYREIRHVSTWDSEIYDRLREKVFADPTYCLTQETVIKQINPKKNRFEVVGEGVLSLSKEEFVLQGTVNGAEIDVRLPSKMIPALPSSPGKHIEIQYGSEIYRCCLKEGKYVVKYNHLIKIFYEMNNGEVIKYYPKNYKKIIKKALI